MEKIEKMMVAREMVNKIIAGRRIDYRLVEDLEIGEALARKEGILLEYRSALGAGIFIYSQIGPKWVGPVLADILIRSCCADVHNDKYTLKTQVRTCGEIKVITVTDLVDYWD